MRAFISYSHRDADALDRLHVHLANLQREGRIETWYDREILAGEALDDEICEELEAAGRFPRRIRMAGTTVAWFLSEIEDWLAERAAERARTHYADY